jgi:DNA-directed RNA polymerase subunit K/omega
MTNKKTESKTNEGAQIIGCDNKYLLVNITAKRARKIMEGARPLVPFDKFDPIEIANKEIKSGVLKFGEKSKNKKEAKS